MFKKNLNSEIGKGLDAPRDPTRAELYPHLNLVLSELQRDSVPVVRARCPLKAYKEGRRVDVTFNSMK